MASQEWLKGKDAIEPDARALPVALDDGTVAPLLWFLRPSATVKMVRRDICERVIHFTKGADHQDAFARLSSILVESRLLGGTGNIKGGYRCVCFTEAPLEMLPRGFVNSTAFGRYSPFGLMFDKQWLFANSGRPAIYQSDDEFLLLPDESRWRHVRYEPNSTPPIDFTWEREWRVHTDELNFTPDVATIVVPSQDWYEALVTEHAAAQDTEIGYLVMGGMEPYQAEAYRQPFPWAGMWLG
jgi:hypothetical protein